MRRIRVVRYPYRPGLPYFFPGDRSGVPLQLPMYRLRIDLAIVPRDYDGGHPLGIEGVVQTPAILDTGAPLSVFPGPVWEEFADRVRWLDQPPGTPRRLTILGGAFGYRIGRVKAGVVDPERRWLPPVTLTGFFLEDAAGAPRESVLGLRSPVLESRQLRHEPTTDEPGRWWLEDAG